MPSKLHFLQTNCLILKLVLLHGTKSAPNELLWNSFITSELSKFSKVLYAKPTFSKLNNSLVSQEAKLDLVLSTRNVELLSTVLFNIRGVQMETNYRFQNELICPPIEEYFLLEESNQYLENLRTSLIKRWNVNRHSKMHLDGKTQSTIGISPWLFNSSPTKQVLTSDNNSVMLNRRNLMKGQYDLNDHQGSRFFQESVKRDLPQSPSSSHSTHRFSSIIGEKSNLKHSSLALTPIIYESFDAMPYGLQKWLHNVVEDDYISQNDNIDRLDLLLDGFKGFG